MSISLLYGCGQIEMVVRDLDAARSFLEDVLGGAPIEQELVGALRALLPPGYGIDNIDCGQATFQFNEAPAAEPGGPDLGVHAGYLGRVGPCVTNLNFYLDDVFHARDVFTERGAAISMQGPTTIVETFVDYGPSNTRPGGADRPFLFMGTHDLLGFDFECMEPNFVHFSEQSAQLPCYVGERPGDGVPGLELQRLTLVVTSLTDTLDNLVDLFTPASRSAPYDVRSGTDGAAFRVGLGGIELEYCEPRRAGTALADHLERFGSGVVWAEFGAPSLDAVLARVPADAPWAVTRGADLIGEARSSARAHIACREVVGFDVVVEEHGPGVGAG